MELTSNYKTGRQFVFVNFHMGIKFRDNLFSRFFYNRGEREIKEPRN